MKKIIFLIMFFLVGQDVFPASYSPTEDSIKKLLILSNFKKESEDKIKKINKRAVNKIKENLKKELADNLQGRPISSKQTALLNSKLPQILHMIDREVRWGIMEPYIQKIYYDNMTQEEVDRANSYYKSPTSVAVMVKMPSIQQKIQEIKKNYNQQVIVEKIGKKEIDTPIKIDSVDPLFKQFVLPNTITKEELRNIKEIFEVLEYKKNFEEDLKKEIDEVEKEAAIKLGPIGEEASREKVSKFIQKEMSWEARQALLIKVFYEGFTKEELGRWLGYSKSSAAMDEFKCRKLTKQLIDQRVDNTWRMAVQFSNDLESEFKFLAPKTKGEPK